jgi:hypothetical protein
MKWNTNTEKITKKAAKRIFLLKVFKSYGASSGDMKEFYITVIRPTLQGVSQKKKVLSIKRTLGKFFDRSKSLCRNK